MQKTTNRYSTIYLAGGCFWGVQKYFSSIVGVICTEVGYANGDGSIPTYQMVCDGHHNYAETVYITYDSTIVPLPFLLDMYYKIIDPTSINRQGNDIGIQYRTGIYFKDVEDKPIIQDSLQNLQKKYSEQLRIEVEPLHHYFSAETYHQDYLEKHPDGYCHIPSSKFLEATTTKPRFQRLCEDELRKKLNSEQYAITQENATEHPYKNAYWNTFEDGIYVDITSGEPLFISSDKFSSGCGWPSFTKPINKQLVKEKIDITHGMERVEVRSKLGDSHLGHVFHDGPEESGGLRYCINSASLEFIPITKMEEFGYGDYLYLFSES